MGKNSGRAVKSQKEIVFDDSARKDYLTGFRKRKNERRQYARQKIAEEVRQERIKDRKEQREYLREQHSIGMGDGREDVEDDQESDDDEAEPANAELSSFLNGDMLITTVVEPLQGSDVHMGSAPSQATKQQSREEQAAARRLAEQPKTKKFDLKKSISQTIHGYKMPSGIKKKTRVKGKKKASSKKDKARARAPRRD
jgi:ribosomal RNA-processing protein 17